MNAATEPGGPAQHWDDAYSNGETTRSWYQTYPGKSLQLLDLAGVTHHEPVVDVGGGASTLVDALLTGGFSDLTVLDISAAGMSAARRRLGPSAGLVEWVVADVQTWRPPRSFRVWHDRAVFHFLTSPSARTSYLRVLKAATTVGAVAVLGVFAPDGPQQCSGLPVVRYDAEELAATLGNSWQMIGRDREEHTTPSGSTQPFTWAVFRRVA